MAMMQNCDDKASRSGVGLPGYSDPENTPVVETVRHVERELPLIVALLKICLSEGLTCGCLRHLIDLKENRL